jgi:hypothetical protein
MGINILDWTTITSHLLLPLRLIVFFQSLPYLNGGGEGEGTLAALKTIGEGMVVAQDGRVQI